jgi:predicted transcriptional regulator
MASQSRKNDMMDERAQDLLNHIAGTSLRIDILSVVADEPMDLRDLSDQLEEPRTTVRHNLDKMIEAGLITETIERSYRCTSIGWAVLTGLETFNECLGAALRLEPLFQCLSPAEFGLEISALTDAEVTTASQARPYAPYRRLSNLVGESEEVDGFLPTNPFLFGPPNGTEFNHGECKLSLFVTDDVATILCDQLESDSGLSRDFFNLWIVSERPVNYGFAIADDRVLILGFDENNKPHVLVETTGCECHKWAERQFDKLKTQATEIKSLDLIAQ